MKIGPVARAAAGGVSTRRVQTFVIGLVLLVSTGASVLAVALLADSSSPFDRAFAAQHGAHVVATVVPARATGAELAATKRLTGVTAAGRCACRCGSTWPYRWPCVPWSASLRWCRHCGLGG